MFATLACVASLIQGTVSLEIKAERLERAAPAIGRALGMEPLAISPPLKDEVLAFRCKDVTAIETQSKIETVLNASFVKRNTGWSLEQTPEQQAQDVQRQRTFAYNKYAKLVERCQAVLAEHGPFDAKAASKLQNDLKQISSREVSFNDELIYDRIRRIGLQSPASKFALRLISRLRAKDWMPLSRNRPKIVYSMNPTKVQSPMPFSVKDIAEQLIRDQALWVDLYGANTLPGPRYREIDGSLSDYVSLGDANDSRFKYEADAFTNVICTVFWNDNSVSITCFDKQGIQTGNMYLSLADVEKELPKEPTIDKHATPFVYTEEMNLFNSAFRGDRSRVVSSTMPQSLVDKLLQPLVVDPLSICAYPQMAHSAREKNFAVVLGDELIGEKGISFQKLKDDTERMEVSESDTWIVSTNRNALEARVDRTDRRVATRLFELVHSRKKDLSMEERARFIAAQPVMRENDGYMHHVGTLLGRLGVRTFRDPASHRVYGILSDSERAIIARAPVPIRSLSPSAREVLNFELFLRPYGTFPRAKAVDMTKLTEAEQDQFNQVENLISVGILSEESFLVPNGLTGDETLSSTETNAVSLICGAPPGVVDGMGRVLTPETLGRYLAQLEVKDLRYGNVGIFEPDLNAIWIGNKRSVTITLRVSKFAEFVWFVTDTTVESSKKTRFEDLPSDILERVRIAQQKAKADFERMRTVRTIDKSAPPPL